jgi:tRNA pseudouridine32 synthase/23S rRNA pseudouridine746 synthase
VNGLTLLHRDRSLLAVDKPAGLLAVPGRGEGKQDCVARRVQVAHPQALVVHRLDEATSGVLLFGLGAQAQRALSIAFAERRVAKRYVALVHGLIVDDAGAIELPLAADWPNRPRQRVDHERGKPSQTRWRVLGRDEAAQRTRLALEPHTGRSHQLRVHVAAIGHPIVGDALYGPPLPVPPPRLMLHARELHLAHPLDGHMLTIQSQVPF